MTSRFAIISCSHKVDYFNKNVVASLPDDPELLQIILVDNTGNQYSVPQALNIGMAQADAQVLIFCHHDIVFPLNWLQTLQNQMDVIERDDKNWGVLGVMGVGNNGSGIGSIADPYSTRKLGQLPSAVQSLDEVCLIVKSGNGFRFDEDLGGFHLYGADLCLQSHNMGMKCYGIEATLQHLSAGALDRTFFDIASKLRKKWSRVSGSPLTIETTCGVFALRENFFAKFIAALKIVRRKFCWGMGSLRDLSKL